MMGGAKGHAQGDRAGMAILSLAIGTFAIGTGEFAMMGLLPEVAGSLHASIPDAGNIVSAYALGVVIGSPAISVATAKMSRKSLLLALMLWFAATNMIGAFAPGIRSLELWRFLAGFSHGSFFGGAALVAANLVEHGRRGRAVSHVFSGLTVANVVGAPLAGLLGQYVPWNVAYLAIGAMGLIAWVMILRFLPADSPRPGSSALGELRAFGRPQVWYVMGIVIFGCGGMFSVYTYFASALTSVAHAPTWSVPLYQSLWGIGMVVGAYAGGAMIDRNPFRATIAAFLWTAFSLAFFAITLNNIALVTLAVFFLGGTITVGPAMQMRLMAVAGDAQVLAAALNHAAFNMANAVGAWVGAAVLAGGLGYAATGWAGMGLSFIGLGLFVLATLSERTSRRADGAV